MSPIKLSVVKTTVIKLIAVNISGFLNSVADFKSKIIALKTMYADNSILSNRLEQYGGATDLCEMRIVEQKETVLQLQDNWYLVYSPIAFTSYITCLNNSNSEVFLKTGPNRVYVSPSCRK